jgi:hypothetical protein
VNFWENADAQNRMKTDIEDVLFEIRDKNGALLALDDIDALLESVLNVARRNNPA